MIFLRFLMMPKDLLRATVLLLCLSMLSGCGFQLKGQYHYPFKRLYIVSTGVSTETRVRLKRMLLAGSNTVVVNNPQTAEATLSISAVRDQRTLSLTEQGATKEYTLTAAVSYTLTGPNGIAYIKPGVITVSRDMTYRDQYALAKEAESAWLYQDMENDVVDQLLRRLMNARILNIQSHTPVQHPQHPPAPLPPPPFR
jgi:LPS-assembly lipoprotein